MPFLISQEPEARFFGGHQLEICAAIADDSFFFFLVGLLRGPMHSKEALLSHITSIRREGPVAFLGLNSRPMIKLREIPTSSHTCNLL